MTPRAQNLTGMLRVPTSGRRIDLTTVDAGSTPGFTGGKKDGKKALAGLAEELSELQERLFAEGRSGGSRSLLLVLQGMDTSGKGGTLRHAVGIFDPQGVRIASFKAPTRAELRHDFLWRVEKQLPDPGTIGIFDRSHYEDVLIARVHALAPEEEIDRRYDAINAFEQRLVDGGTTVLKCLLHISAEEQKDRLLARLDDPTKHWKFDPGDVEERASWSDYRDAYETAMRWCSTDAAPWLVVPADRKWYRNWAVATVLLDALRGLDLQWPAADFDVQEQRRRLEREDPVS